jgi:hypothetical protein
MSWRRKLATIITVFAAVGAAVVVAPEPASASTFTPCTLGQDYGPYFYGNKYVRDRTGGTYVLAVASPWTAGSGAYIWADNGFSNQRWYLRCLGSDPVAQYKIYQLRIASDSDRSLCLGYSVGTNGVRPSLRECGGGTGTAWYYWRTSSGYYTFESDWGYCLSAVGVASGSAVKLLECGGNVMPAPPTAPDSSQLWF